MKLESQTVSILKNFAAINPSISFKDGQKLRTISPSKTILAQASITNDMPGTFAIYDLSRFLSVLSLFEQPAIEVEEKYLTIKDDQQTVNYAFANPSMIVAPTDKTPVVPNPEITFNLTADTLVRVQKAMGVLNMPEMSVVGDGVNVYVQASDSKKPGSDTFAIKVGTNDNKFNMIFKADNMKMLPGSYVVQISSKGIAHFKQDVVEYWIATEATSTFGG